MDDYDNSDMGSLNDAIIAAIPQEHGEITSLAKTVHSMPIKIKYDGPAKVSSYFNPQKKVKYISALASSDIGPLQADTSNGTEFFVAAFRGRQVTGREVNLRANNAIGLIVEGGVKEKQAPPVQYRKIGKNKNAPAAPAPTPTAEATPSVKPNATVTGVFDTMMVWNKDDLEITTDHISYSIDEFLPLAHALHSE